MSNPNFKKNIIQVLISQTCDAYYNSVGDIDAYCYEYDHVNNHHMAYGFDNIFKDYGQGQGYDHFHCDYDHDDDVGHKGQMNDHD